jgi:hypothetical protein
MEQKTGRTRKGQVEDRHSTPIQPQLWDRCRGTAKLARSVSSSPSGSSSVRYCFVQKGERICNSLVVEKFLTIRRQIIDRTHVNLVDLVDYPLTGRLAEIFASEKELSEYTRRTEKIMTSKLAGSLLRHLRRRIKDPAMKRGRRSLPASYESSEMQA